MPEYLLMDIGWPEFNYYRRTCPTQNPGFMGEILDVGSHYSDRAKNERWGVCEAVEGLDDG